MPHTFLGDITPTLQLLLFARLAPSQAYILIVINLAPFPPPGYTTMDQQNHHSFVDLDNHESQTDAEALEAIRVAIGQSADFNDQPLSDVLHNHDHEQEQDDGELEQDVGGSAVPMSNPGASTAQLEKCVNELLEVSQASLWEIETANAPVSGETWLRIQGHGKKQIRLTKNLLELVKQQPQPQPCK